MTGEEVRTVEEKRAPRTGRPQILLTLVEKRGPCGCHRGHKVGDAFDFDRLNTRDDGKSQRNEHDRYKGVNPQL